MWFRLANMSRWRRLLRAKSSVDLTIVALVLCICLFVFRHFNQRTAVHRQTAGDDSDGELSEISLNDEQQQQQQQIAASPTTVELHRSQRTRDVDQRIMHVADFRSADCRRVSICMTLSFCIIIFIDRNSINYYPDYLHSVLSGLCCYSCVQTRA